MDRTSAGGLRHLLHGLADSLRRHLAERLLRELARGDPLRLRRIEEVHLGTDHVERRAVPLEVGDLPREGVHVVLVDVEPRIGLHVLARQDERIVGVVRRHEPVVALRDRKAVLRALAERPVGRALVHNVPRVDARTVALADFADALLKEEVLRLDERRDERGDLLLGELGVDLLPCAVPPAPSGILPHVLGADRLLDVAHRHLYAGSGLKGALLALGAEVVPKPRGRMPFVVAPHERVPVDANAARLEVADDWIGRGATPVRLVRDGLRVALVLAVPVLLGVLVAFLETRGIRMLLERAPVERDSRGVEESAVQFLVAVVPLLLAELVEVEDVRAEIERVADLLDLHIRAVGSRDFDCRVRLAVLLDVGVDLRLDLVVPDRPVFVAHHRAVHGKISLRRKSRGGDCTRGKHHCLVHLHSPLFINS